jgi:2-succinyl-5-enolpyruvyl-6-hydroxy-3-cyclohexene-1-carboxylate synthase
MVSGEMRDGGRLARVMPRIPILAEPSSQLRLAELPGVVPEYEALLHDAAWAARRRPDLVVRLGATPTSKALNAWLATQGVRTILIDPDRAWPDPDVVATDVFRCSPEPLLAGAAAVSRPEPGWLEDWDAAASAARAALERALAAGPLHEGTAVRALARVLPAGCSLFVGSSLPIRAVDSFWPASGPGLRFLGNRGASGIDGLVSTGLGMAAAAADPAVLLLGDLSLYHDMNGLWALRRHDLRAAIVVLDNGGGGIFAFLPQAAHEDVFEELFLTPLGLKMEAVARLYGLEYCEVREAVGLEPALRAALAAERSALVRVVIDHRESVSGWRACWTAVSEALAGR